MCRVMTSVASWWDYACEWVLRARVGKNVDMSVDMSVSMRVGMSFEWLCLIQL